MECALLQQQIIFDNHDWQFGSPLELLDDLNDHLDVAVSNLPIGLPPKKHNLIIKEKHTVELFGPLEQLILANTTSKLLQMTALRGLMTLQKRKYAEKLINGPNRVLSALKLNKPLLMKQRF